MADLSAISALSSINAKDLYYQYLINNNSTSTMLNALSGNYGDSSDGTGLSGLVSAVSQTYSSSALSSLVGQALGTSGTGDLSMLGLASDFSSILELYLGAQTSEAGAMAGKLQDALSEAEEAGETSTKSYKTVQELYKYFTDKSSAAAQALNKNTSQSPVETTEAAVSTSTPSPARGMADFDFDSYIENIDKQIESAISSTVSSAGISMI